MPYNPSTIVPAYAPADRFFSIADSNGNIVATFIPTKVNKILQEESTISIVIESFGSPFEFKLEMDSKADAIAAYTAINTAYTTLYDNALEIGNNVSPMPSPYVLVSKTLAQYITDAGGNALIPMQYYQISDGGNILGLGTNYLFQALTVNDMKPNGLVQTTGVSFTTDLSFPKVTSLNNPTDNIYTFNSGVVSTTGTSEYLTVANNGTLAAINSSFITVDDAVATLTNCNNIVVERGANVTADGIERVEFSGNFTTIVPPAYAGLLQDVRIDNSTTIGKLAAREDIFAKTELVAYIDSVDQELATSLTTDKVVPIKTNFVDSGSDFRFKANAGRFSAYRITFRKMDNSPLLVVDSSYEGSIITFRFDKTIGDYYVASIEALVEKVDILTIAVDGTTTFPLTAKSNDPTDSEATVNGVELTYGVHYTILNDIFTYLNVDYTLITTDTLKVRYK